MSNHSESLLLQPPTLADETEPQKDQSVLAAQAAQAALAHLPGLMRELRSAMRRFAPQGISVPQFRALLFAKAQPQAGVVELAQHLGVTVPTASAAVALLCDKGYLQLHAHEQDKRRKRMTLTALGQQAVNQAWQQTGLDFQTRFSTLSVAQLQPIAPALAALTQALCPYPGLD